ncbi:DUF4149 domain-containing protein [Neisseria leonii]|uniref:DUF4149 domain-containing protein n=1 Tax=Neisseria leonii TaxID=2995413 RepID=UPI00237C3E2F|nr:DUF4149 domain-containing protein [Neisseria sp. 3986]MDD9326182.1 DUF4149 domain-containing protein [Neisseria sp. 3986]
MNRVIAVLCGVWLGMQIMAGYIAAPLLFSRLPRLEAGALAGTMFGINHYLGLAVWGLAYWAARHGMRHGFSTGRSAAPKMILLLLVLLAANQFLMTPVIESLKAGGSHWLSDWVGGSFGKWHGISSVLYLLCCLLGLGLLLRYLRFDAR